MASGKSLKPEENEKLRVVLRQLVEQHGSQKAVVDAIVKKLKQPASQQMMSHVLNGGRGGVHFATLIAEFLGHQTYKDLLGPNAVPTYGEHASWKENEAEAIASHPFPEAALKLARETPAYIQRENYSPSAIVATVLWRWAMASDEEKRRVATDSAKDEVTAERTRRPRIKKDPPSTPRLPPARRGT